LNKLKNLESQELWLRQTHQESQSIFMKDEAKIFRNIFVELTFFPARYLKLFEIIPGPQTSTEVDFTIYGEKFLGKTSVVMITQLHWKPCWYLRNSKLIPFGKRNGLDY
jgi:hypothetical protein